MLVRIASIRPSCAAAALASRKDVPRAASVAEPTRATPIARTAVTAAAIRMRVGVFVRRSDSSRDTLAGAAVVTIPKYVLFPLPQRFPRRLRAYAPTVSG